MFKLLANIFGYALNFIYGFVNNYGVAIIIFTVLLRLLLLPMNLKQQKTMKKTAKIQDEMKELQEKYANDTVRLSQEVQDLYKRENLSPFSGCLGSIVQIVIIISMFYLVANPLTYMKHLPSETIEAYEAEVSEMEDVDSTRYLEISVIRNLGDKYEEVNLNMNFLGLNLGDIPTLNYTDLRVFIIPILYVITSIISMRLTYQTSNKKDEKEKIEAKKEDEKLAKIEEPDEQAEMMERMNRNMRYMTPFMAVMVALIAPLGLALYWFVSNLVMIVERLIVNKIVNKEEI